MTKPLVTVTTAAHRVNRPQIPIKAERRVRKRSGRMSLRSVKRDDRKYHANLCCEPESVQGSVVIKDHPRYARLASTCPFGPDAVVDTAVALKPSVEKEHARLLRLPAARRQTKVAEQQHRVSRRDPLWRVKTAV